MFSFIAIVVGGLIGLAANVWGFSITDWRWWLITLPTSLCVGVMAGLAD